MIYYYVQLSHDGTSFLLFGVYKVLGSAKEYQIANFADKELAEKVGRWLCGK
jgi:hypothetical protein